jgi:hypothetical protein
LSSSLTSAPSEWLAIAPALALLCGISPDVLRRSCPPRQSLEAYVGLLLLLLAPVCIKSEEIKLPCHHNEIFKKVT